MTSSFLTGPVTVSPAVRAAFGAPAVSHRAPAFGECMRRTRAALKSLTGASHVALMVGSGTLANDAVAAQLVDAGHGLVLSNGEFGERLIDHAQRWRLEFTAVRQRWGSAFDWHDARRAAHACGARWIWATLTETSTGVANELHELRALAAELGAGLCLDAVSAIGMAPVDLRGVRFATAVSGKGLASFPGLAAVFHDGHLAPGAHIPRYLDLRAWEAADGVPFTHSSNLLAALECSLTRTDWTARYRRIAEQSTALRQDLRRRGLEPLAGDAHAAAGIVTLAMERGVDAGAVARDLLARGFEVGSGSGYLIQRNWIQIALMGAIEESALEALPAALADGIARAAARRTTPRSRTSPRTRTMAELAG